ncbi:MAG: hypothetical protein ACXQTI_08985 [Candidatus Nezhaarchaeales archaeon]
MRPGTKIYITRIVFAVMAGLISAIINPILFTTQSYGLPASLLPVIIAAMLYIASYYFVKLVIKIAPSALNEPSYIYKGGLFTYILIWIITWSLIASLCCPSLIHYPSS